MTAALGHESSFNSWQLTSLWSTLFSQLLPHPVSFFFPDADLTSTRNLKYMVSQGSVQDLFFFLPLFCFFLDGLINFHGFNAISILMLLKYISSSNPASLTACCMHHWEVSDISNMVCSNRMLAFLHKMLSLHQLHHIVIPETSVYLSLPWTPHPTIIDTWEQISPQTSALHLWSQHFSHTFLQQPPSSWSTIHLYSAAKWF